MNAKLKTKLDHLREAIREISKGYNGYFFSNKKTRKDLLYMVDGLSEGSLNRYIYLLKDEGFLEPTLMGKGVHKLSC